MKTYPDRLWLVLLGVAVAILVMLTTILWTPSPERSGADSKPAGAPTSHTLAPRIGGELIKFFRKTSIEPSVRNK